MRKLILGLAVLALFLVSTPAVYAQTTYNSISVQGQPGEPRASFYFGHSPNGEPGTTVLEVQCDFKRAWLITNYGTTQEETSSNLAISCSSSNPAGPYTVESTPLTGTLTMYQGGNPVGTVTLTINSASFTVSGRYHPSTGAASITF